MNSAVRFCTALILITGLSACSTADPFRWALLNAQDLFLISEGDYLYPAMRTSDRIYESEPPQIDIKQYRKETTERAPINAVVDPLSVTSKNHQAEYLDGGWQNASSFKLEGLSYYIRKTPGSDWETIDTSRIRFR